VQLRMIEQKAARLGGKYLEPGLDILSPMV
jgi:hypothetical protein